MVEQVEYFSGRNNKLGYFFSACVSPCKTCEETIYTCTSCEEGYTLENGDCVPTSKKNINLKINLF